MANYFLRKYGDPVLRSVCTPVSDFSTLDPLINAMYSVLDECGGAGLSAPQVGDTRRVLLAKLDGQRKVMINPVIQGFRGNTLSLESCLSLPGLALLLLRKKEITLDYQTKNGNPKSVVLSGGPSIIVQHEIDHLNGKLLIDKYKFW